MSHLTRTLGLVRAQVRHRRYMPLNRVFNYALTYIWIDVDQVVALTGRSPTWSWNRTNLTSLAREDLLAPVHLSVREAVSRQCEQDIGISLCQQDQIRLLTLPRWLGHTFNPVSFYLILRNDRPLAVVSDITNTPWGERHARAFSLLPASEQGSSTTRVVFDKDFHVSPFMPMDMQYDWRFHWKAVSDSVIHMALWREGTLWFDATLRLSIKPMTRWQQHTYGLRHMAQGMHTLARIYWQALQLWLRGVRFYPQPGRTAAQDTVT